MIRPLKGKSQGPLAHNAQSTNTMERKIRQKERRKLVRGNTENQCAELLEKMPGDRPRKWNSWLCLWLTGWENREGSPGHERNYSRANRQNKWLSRNALISKGGRWEYPATVLQTFISLTTLIVKQTGAWTQPVVIIRSILSKSVDTRGTGLVIPGIKLLKLGVVMRGESVASMRIPELVESIKNSVVDCKNVVIN